MPSSQSEFCSIFGGLRSADLVTVEQAYHYRVHPQWNFTDKSFDAYYALMVKNGVLHFSFAGEKLDVGDGQVLFVAPNTPFDVTHDPECPAFVSPCLFSVNMGEPASGKGWFYLSNYKNTAELALLFEKTAYYFTNSEDPLYQRLCNNCMFEILALVYIAAEHDLGIADDACDNRAIRCARIIEGEPFRRMSTEDLASTVGLSAKQLRIVFKRSYGRTPKEYQLYVRMRYAEHLLYENRYSLPAIASMLGYSDQYAFSRQYKMLMGISPSRVMKPKHERTD